MQKMKIHFATGNKNKLEEFRKELEGTGIELVQLETDIPEIDHEDVEKVAERKAVDSFLESDIDEPVMVEDTGLYIKKLSGFPGSMAGYFFKKCGNEGVLKLMEDVGNREAFFKTAIAIYYPEKDQVETFTGKCMGEIAEGILGEEDFGYDPIFIPENHNKTFAEDMDYKLKVSHRKRAIENMRKEL